MENVILEEFVIENLKKNAPGPVKTMFGLPLKQTFDHEDYCIMGVPYDTSTTNRPGARFGPRAIREFMGRFSKYNQDMDWEMDNISGMDYGDIQVMNGYTLQSLQLIYEGVKRILDNGAVPIVLGGDHLITYAELRAYAEKYGPVAMVHFDSHNDTSEKGFSDEIYTHGTPFRRAIEDGYLDPARSIQVGIRGYMDTYRLVYAREKGMKVITARELHGIGIRKAAEMIRTQVSGKCIVTFDIDFLDPSAAPGTGTPAPGGFTTWQAMELLREGLSGLDIVGFDMVEVMEDYDPGHITALAAGHMVYQFISILSKNKKLKQGE